MTISTAQITEFGVVVPSADPVFEAAKQMYLTEKASLITIQDLINADNPDAAEILKTYSFMRGAQAISEAPNMQAMADLTVAHPTLFNNLDSLGLDKSYQSVWNNHERGPQLAAEVENALTAGRALQVYKAETIPHTTSDEFLDESDRRRRGAPNPSGVAMDGRDPKKTATAGLSQLDHLTNGFELNGEPEFLNEASGLADVVGWIDTVGNILDTGVIQHEPDKAKIRESLASDAMQRAVGQIGTGRQDTRVQAMATRLGEYWDKAAGDSRKEWSNDIGKLAAQNFRNVPTAQYLTPNLSGLRENGTVTFTVERDRVFKLVRAMPLNAQLPDKALKRQIDQTVRALQRSAERLGKQMTTFIPADANL